MSHLICNMSHVTFHRSPVTYHISLMPTVTTLILLTPPLCTVGWFAKTPQPKKSKIAKKSSRWSKKIPHIGDTESGGEGGGRG